MGEAKRYREVPTTPCPHCGGRNSGRAEMIPGPGTVFTTTVGARPDGSFDWIYVCDDEGRADCPNMRRANILRTRLDRR
jgi:hypothetical protein